jgi:hypothetical protein
MVSPGSKAPANVTIEPWERPRAREYLTEHEVEASGIVTPR